VILHGMVRALVFDVFGTLVDWRTKISEALGSEELADAWRARYRPILEEVNDGRRPWGDFDELHLATLEGLVDLPLEERRRLVQAWHRLDPWPDVRAGLDELRRDRITAALSNGHIALLVDLARHGDLRFDCLLSAELARAYKPEPEVYRTAARLLGVEPGELMLVAAHPWDLEGARAAGLRTAFIDRPLEYGPGSPAREFPEADVSASDLHELALGISPM
jgi:2-haloacid dehalogenase